MSTFSMLRRLLCAAIVAALVTPAEGSQQKPIKDPPPGYEHDRFAPEPDIKRVFHAFIVSFDSKDDDDGDDIEDLLRVPHWVAQEIRRWEPEPALQDDDAAWCLDTLKNRPSWFTDPDLFNSGVAGNDDSYRNSGFDRGHMAMKLLVERLGQDAAWNTHTVLNAIPQRPKFNQGIWQKLELLTGAWAQEYGKVWVIQGPVFYGPPIFLIGDEGERTIAVPDAAFKVVFRDKTEAEAAAAPPSEKTAPEILAFMYPQLGARYFGTSADFEHERFLTTVEEVEKLTGLVFEVSSNSALSKKLKRRRAARLWDHSKHFSQRARNFLTGCRSN